MIPSQENDDDSGAKHLKQKKKNKKQLLGYVAKPGDLQLVPEKENFLEHE